MDARICSVGIPLACKCDCCVNSSVETLDHIFSMSELARKVWKRAALAFGVQHQGASSWWSKVITWLTYDRKSSQRVVLIGLLPCLIIWRLCVR